MAPEKGGDPRSGEDRQGLGPVAFVLYYLLKHRSKLFHAFAGAEAAVEDVVDHVSDRHFDVVPFVDFFDACSCVVTFCHHCHFVKCASHGAAMSDQLTKTTVAAER